MPALLFLGSGLRNGIDLCFHWNSRGALNMKTRVCAKLLQSCLTLRPYGPQPAREADLLTNI